MNLDDLKRDGWEVIEEWEGDFVVSRGHQRMLVDSNGNVIIMY